MSIAALLLATRDQIRQAVDLSQDECEVMLDGRPQPKCGARFVSVWFGYWRDQGSNAESLHEGYGVNVTVTYRITPTPFDRIGPDLLVKANTGLLDFAAKIKAAIHMDPNDSLMNSVMGKANAIIGVNYDGFIVPLQFQNGGNPEQKGGAWFNSQSGEALAGVALTMPFGLAERVQKIEEQG